MKHYPNVIGVILRFIGAAGSGFVFSLLFCIGVGLIFFAIGAITRASFMFHIGPLLLLHVDTSAGRLNLLFGPGTVVVSVALGLLNGVGVELVRRRYRKTTIPMEGRQE